MSDTDLDRTAEEITRKSRSNLAFAFITLPQERRDDMVRYYAFCRIVDDIVDEPGPTKSERVALLDRWRKGFLGELSDPSSFEQEVIQLQSKYAIPTEHFHLLIDGMEMDLEQREYETFDDLLAYCYRAAGAVGLVCMRIMGCDFERSEPYAVNLGYCLQLTNIIRDVGDDWQRFQRVYLPTEDLEAFRLKAPPFDGDAAERKRFLDLMEFQYDRNVSYYHIAADAVPLEERRHLVAMETMRATYRALLDRMQQDGFQVFEKQYRLAKLEKVGILTRQFITSLLPA